MNQDPPDIRKVLLFISGVGLLGFAAFLIVFGNLFSSEPASPVVNVQVTPISASATRPSPIDPELDKAVQVGAVAPNFMLADLDGNQHALADLQGKPVIINFWATWCAPCRIEMPEFEEAFADYASDELVILAVNREESAETVEAFFVDDLGLSFTPLLDETAVAADLYGVFSMPTTYFVDGDGVVQAVHRGPVAREQLDGYIALLLDES